MQLTKTLEIRSSPHIASGASTDSIMFNVFLALVPTTGYAVYLFGFAAAITLLVAVVSCVATEHFLVLMSGKRTTVSDWSAAVTGLLYGLTLPPGLPIWMVIVGGFLGIGVAKTLFGGLGYNCFNPALVGRALLQAAFPAAMTTWTSSAADRFTSLPASTLTWPFSQPVYDAISSATPLSQWQFDQVRTDTWDLFVGSIAGSTGETSACLILLGGVYLAVRRMLNWRIPLAVLGTVALLSALLQWMDPSRSAGPLFMLFSGGLMLGAVFMATDMVASPMTHAGCLLYGGLIGLLVFVIRVWGGMPEGVMYAILLGNAVSPHIDRWIQPSVYGTRRASGRQSAEAASSLQAGVAATESASSPTSAAAAQSSGNSSLRNDSASNQPVLTNAPVTPAMPMMATLVGVGAVCGIAIVGVYLLTLPIIERNQIALRQQAALAVLPGAVSIQAFQWSEDGRFLATAPETEGADVVYAGYDSQGRLVGIALTGQSTGYQDVVQIAYGYSMDSQTILGFRVLASRETPGLGDRIETDEDFQRNFDRLDVSVTSEGDQLINRIQFVKPGEKTQDWQIDGISGATITSSTIARILSDGADYWIPKLWQHREDFQLAQDGRIVDAADDAGR
jgi:Na+-translocating ferredoxin:NAD+ oxidoreductase subunit D